MISNELQQKIDRAIKLLQSIQNRGGQIEVAYSGGKDSDVILQLAKESGINYHAIYKNTTIDPPGTVAHVKKMGVDVLMPKDGETFFKLMEKRGMPTRFVRLCCSTLKEYQTEGYSQTILGVRKEESAKRAKLYNEPTMCIGTKAKPREGIYPILDWTNKDVADFIADRKITCAPIYYDENGIFHVERRLGCMCCPLVNRKKRLAEFMEHPNMVKAYCRAACRYIANHPESSASKYCKDGYELFVMNVFYDSKADFEIAVRGLIGNIDCKQTLEDYFHIKFNENTY